MTDVIKGTSGQNRYLVMTEQYARQIMSSVPNLKFYRCEQLGEFNSVLGGLSVTPKIELCHKLNMIGTNYDSFLMSQFKDGILQMYFTGTTHYTAASNKLADGSESTFYFTPAIYGVEYSGVKYNKLATNEAASNQYLQRFKLDDIKAQTLVVNFYNNAGSMYKNGTPQYASAKAYETHLVTLLVNGDAIVIEKPKSLFIPVEEIISTAVGVSVLRPSQIEAEPEPEKFWLKIQSLYDDKWDTPLPITVQVVVDGVVIASGLELSKGAGKNTKSSNLKAALKTQGEPGTVVLEDIPEGLVEVTVERVTGVEQDIASLKKKLRTTLDSGYKDVVKDMQPFREQWNDYGYASLVLSGAQGALTGGDGWLDDQKELFDGDTWEQFGKSISEGLSDALDYTASYIPETYDSITESIEETLEDIEENSDNLASWNWWDQQVKEGVDRTVRKIDSNFDDAKEFLDESTDSIAKLIKYKSAILRLPKQISRGDAKSVQSFVDGPLKDIDPDLSKQIKESAEFYMVLELIADHDSALTYFTYLDLFIEAVPPNFYAYVSGKAGIYILIEIILFVVLSFLTLGVGTAARLTAIAARMTVTSVRVNKKLDKAEKAQQAFKGMVEYFAKSSDTLKKLGQKLAVTRSAGRLSVGTENGTLTTKKKEEKREKKCRLCGGDHDTPKGLKGDVTYE